MVEPEEVRYCRCDLKTRLTAVSAVDLPQDDEEAAKFVRAAMLAFPELYFARFVVLGEGHQRSEELAGEIKTFVRGHLSAYAYPRRIEFVDDLPKTLTGKIRRIELRQREIEDR